MTAREPSRIEAQRGVALVMVLWLTVLLTVIGGAFAFSMRSEALASRNAVSIAQARAAADGAIERMTFELMRPRMRESWAPDGVPHRWSDAGHVIVASARDETAKIDLNTANDALLKGLFVGVGGLEDSAAAALVDAIADWRDADELKRPNGAEASDYRAADSKYAPSNRRFETVGEVTRVRGMTPALYARVAGSITVHSGQPGVNPQTASRDTLLAFPGVTEEVVDEYIARRDEAIASDLAVPPFPPAQGFQAAALPVWRIRAEATRPDGVTFVREAVVRATADVRRPFYALLWSEGERPPLPDATAPAAAAASGSSTRSPVTPLRMNDARRS